MTQNATPFWNVFKRVCNLVNIFRFSSSSTFTFPTNPTIHKVIDDGYLSNFEEVVIIGDIHGCFDEFSLLLEKIHQCDSNKINPQRILKICVGDLLNKGPKNIEVLNYLMNNKDTFLSVRGNHEEHVIKKYKKFLDTGDVIEKNVWIKELKNEHIKYLAELPYTITIPKLNIIIVHAGLVPNVQLEKQNLIDMVKMRNLMEIQEDGKTVYQGTEKDTEGVAWASKWNGPLHVIFGHDAKRKLQEFPLATGLDTGAVYGNQLTAKFVMGPRAGTYVSVNALNTWVVLKTNLN